MPLVLNDPEIDTVVLFLRTQRSAVSSGLIRSQFKPPMNERTVQRLLVSLLDLGVLTATGRRRLRRYQLRSKPGQFGTVMWLHPESNAAAMIASEQQLPAPAAAGEHPTSNAEHRTSNPETKAAQTGPSLDVGSSTLDVRSSAPAAPPLPATKTILPSRVQPLLDRVLPNLFARQITPDRVAAEMRQPAVKLFALKPGETPDDLALLVTAALDQMAAADAAKYGCNATSFARWRDIYWPLGYALTPPTSVTPLPPLPLPTSVSPERATFFLREVPYVVTNRLKPEALRPYLETQRNWLRGNETVDDWLTVLTAELNRLRLEDAQARNIRPEQYRLWRKEAWPTP